MGVKLCNLAKLCLCKSETEQFDAKEFREIGALPPLFACSTSSKIAFEGYLMKKFCVRINLQRKLVKGCLPIGKHQILPIGTYSKLLGFGEVSKLTVTLLLSQRSISKNYVPVCAFLDY